MSKVKVNQDTCIGCGSCSAICPKVFVMEDAKAKVIGEPGEEEDNVKLAKGACPTQAISYDPAFAG